MAAKLIGVCVVTLSLLCGSVMGAGPQYPGHYSLVWFRQWDRSENGHPDPQGCLPNEYGDATVYANHIMQIWVFDEAGAKMGGVEIRDQEGNFQQSQYGDPLFIETRRSDGDRAEIPLFKTHDTGAMCIDDVGSTSDVTPVVTVAYGPCKPYYSYDAGFVFKTNPDGPGQADTSLKGVLPTRSNGSDDNPVSNSMVYSHQDWDDYYGTAAWLLPSGTYVSSHSQTFVATGINRVLGVYLFPVQPANGPTQWRAMIQEGAGPGGPIICENEFPYTMYFSQPLAFARDACPVMPGETYTVTLDPLDPTECNVYEYPNNYPDGTHYAAGVPNGSGRDMYGFVWGWYDTPGTHGMIRGTVVGPDEEPVIKAQVQLTGGPTEMTTKTDHTGGFVFWSAETSSNYAIYVNKDGYWPAGQVGIDVQPDQTTNVGFDLLSPYVWADFNKDDHVDVADFSVFELCFGGTNQPPSDNCPQGISADHDGDNDVDVSDFAAFQVCFGGAGQPYGCPLPPPPPLP